MPESSKPVLTRSESLQDQSSSRIVRAWACIFLWGHRQGSAIQLLQGIGILVMIWSAFFGELSGKEAALGILALIGAAQGLAKILKTKAPQPPSVSKFKG